MSTHENAAGLWKKYIRILKFFQFICFFLNGCAPAVQFPNTTVRTRRPLLSAGFVPKSTQHHLTHIHPRSQDLNHDRLDRSKQTQHPGLRSRIGSKPAPHLLRTPTERDDSSKGIAAATYEIVVGPAPVLPRFRSRFRILFFILFLNSGFEPSSRLAITFQRTTGVVFWRVVYSNEEGVLRKRMILAFAGLTFLAGCGNQGDKAPGIPATPKWKGPAYRLTIGTDQAKPNPAGVTIPAIKYTANPDALERRASLVVRFEPSGAKKDQPMMDQVIVGPFDISGAEGTLPADYMDLADRGLARLLGAYCMKGKVKISVMLVRSSLAPQAGDAEINQKRLSDWLPIDVVFKNPHPGC
jgi:hypothetical protein